MNNSELPTMAEDSSAQVTLTTTFLGSVLLFLALVVKVQ